MYLKFIKISLILLNVFHQTFRCLEYFNTSLKKKLLIKHTKIIKTPSNCPGRVQKTFLSAFKSQTPCFSDFIIITIFFFFFCGLGRLTCSGIDALPSFPRASTISSSSRFVAEGVFRKSGVVHSFKMVDSVMFVFGSHVLYSRDLQFFSYNFASYFF